MVVFSLKFVSGIEWPKNSVHSLLSSPRVVWSSAIVVLEEKALDFRPNYTRFRAAADKCGELFLRDMAHISGLVSAQSFPSIIWVILHHAKIFMHDLCLIHTDFKPENILLVSQSEAKKEQKYNAATTSEWGLLNWVYDNGKMPLLDVYCDASSDIVDFHVSSTLFQCFGTQGNYLRIQEDSLAGDAASMDISTMENMQKLVEIGSNLLKELVSTVDLETGSLSGDAASVDIATNENLKKLAEIGKDLLKEPVSRIDVETGTFKNVEGEGTNEDALTKFAKLLSKERKIRTQHINSSTDDLIL
ncbi:hypothetical protein EZV62_014078 [Acer yangbiense]|uniref:Serine hydroxymethyltransferase-like domain-containing protein n=1 Tax=Acer yangbiense TaxID=1000413 RepID=A0A5C7HRR3_9ROSI|nr:hypothetical protein EZV62_014078 [Acer yangbiense]